MGGTGKKTEPPGKDDGQAKQPPPPKPTEDDDTEDGDFASPKFDRGGPDDEPL